MHKQHNPVLGKEFQLSLQKAAVRWHTRMGLLYPGEEVWLRDKKLLTDFPEKNWFAILLYAITGKDFTAAQLHIMEAIWSICLCFPDPRIWCNRVAALGGTAGTTGSLAIAAALAVSESEIYGQKPVRRAVQSLLDIENELGSKKLPDILEEWKIKNKLIYGFGRPVALRDERVVTLFYLLKYHNLHEEKFICLAFDIEIILQQRNQRLFLNAGGIMGAIACDFGLTAQEFYLFTCSAYSAGITACYLDAYQQPAGHFFPMPVGAVKYAGPEHRAW
ncbi:MAG: hypothetical protein H0W44_06220 [Gammaproteobacteria bacterium]|nr:hypothetical protein [Gammaproteobacteria bacterium]